MKETSGSPPSEGIKFEEVAIPDYHRVVRAVDEKRGLDAIIAIHSLSLASSGLGGVRIHKYPSMADALQDVTRLAQGMSFKSAAVLAGWGGAKAVINADPDRDKTPELLTAFAEAVNYLEGTYICAEDVGSTPEDMAILAKTTPYVVGLPTKGSSGNPSPFTAWGIYRGIQAVMQRLDGTDSIEGRTVAIQGVGSVGSALVETLFWHGANLIISDISPGRLDPMVARFGCRVVQEEEIYEVPCDVFSPCALGGILNPVTIPKLKCRAVAGSANNQLLNPECGEELWRRGILYAPDFVVNSGGLINVTAETAKEGYNPIKSRQKVETLYPQLMDIFAQSEEAGCATVEIVMKLVSDRITNGEGRRTSPVYLHHAGISIG